MNYFLIQLEDCRFFAYHGLYDQERKNGNDFIVNLTLKYPVINPEDDRMENSVSYADLYEIVREEMKIPGNLLESVATRISGRIIEKWPGTLGIEVKITKSHPPIPEFTGRASVTHISEP